MPSWSSLHAGNAAKIGEAFESTGSADEAEQMLAQALLPGIIPDETGEMPNSPDVLTLLTCAVAGRQPIEFSACIAEHLVGDPDPEEATDGAYVMSHAWVELFASLTAEQAASLAIRWFGEFDPEATDSPQHAAGLAPLLDAIVHVCRTAREHDAAVVYVWKM
jgi:hypothetical protein